ncbi:MAG: small ribosomal subunit biogenesis GTPase RsgA [Porticoccaceae bacterium]|nr:small ribosomal subunit biogenesis GTPase RsgA [Porticoccaceae bacterium]
MGNRKLSKRQQERIQSIQNRRREKAESKKHLDDKTLENLDGLGTETSGTVITNYGSQVDIEGHSEPFAGKVVRCFVRANIPSLVTGDNIVWRPAEPQGVVVALEPRQSELIRPDNYGKLRPVAANVDRIGVVFSVQPAPQSNLLDRYLVAAEAQGIEPFLVLNKTDLLDQQTGSEVDSILESYKSIGYEVIGVSAKNNGGMDALKSYLTNKSCIFVGQSGVGKSSLINQLVPDNNSAVGPLSEATNEGTHTTTASKLIHLNTGGVIIDSPGIREFALTHLNQEAIINGFKDFREFLGYCKFRDCKHETDAGCALVEAIAAGKLQQQRLDNYRQIINSLDN